MPKQPDALDFINKLSPYKDAQSLPLSHPGKKNFLKLDCNEAAYPPSPHVRARLLDFIENEPLNWYPDTQSQDLKRALCKYVGYPPEFILTFNGCDHALDSICRTYLTKGDQAIIFSPIYDNFRLFVELTGASVVPFLSSSPFHAKIAGFEKLLTPKTKVIYLANPGNPTGTTYSEEQIRTILDVSNALVIVDEAYFEFWGISSLLLIKDYPNLIITRSFSKAFGLAGLRCGYLITDPRNVHSIEKTRNGKNINALAQLASEAALEDLAYIKEQIQRMHKTKEWFVNTMRTKGLIVDSTVANFVLLKVNCPDEVEKILTNSNILIRNRSRFPQLDGYLRITIGMRREMENLTDILSNITTDLLSCSQAASASKTAAVA